MRTPTLITEHPSSGGSSGIASLLPPMDSMTQVHLQPPPNQSQCLLPLAVPSRFPSPPPPTPNAPLVRRRPRPVQPPLPHTLHMSVLASASPAWGAAQEPQVPIVLPTVTPLPSGPEHGDQSMVAFGFGS
ncbi:hypothetical protein BCR44DRAFT_1429431 [Catenaria anguillulae PL171]|uniref:Uncharacterized protein n=1 Tax=Catenaria anguillulae PL171 TaxID=765915 RepID=A0A1Y2HY11_9FUNG|nr:hypothetical protein BCR44DRAFT_1429431 [Catenaria anguillulae PL171]